MLEPLSAKSRIAKPCPAGSLPFDCAFVEEPVAEDGVKRTLPGSDKSFTRNETYYDYNPADWYPGDHPPMPDIVAHGHANLKLRACALCHYPNGQGRTENGQVAGLSEQYILQQLQAFADGTRRSADPRKANTNEMAMIAARLTDEEKKQAAAYYAAIPFRKMSRAVETTQVPQLRTTLNALMLPIPNQPPMPLGLRIVQVPEDPDRVLLTRNPREQWIAYVPVGSLEAGRKLVTSSVKTVQCALCHGPTLQGLADIPGIGGRTATYLMRQLWDFKQGTRQNMLMQGVVKNLTAEDMMNISAYLTSLDP
jgi:cytochrome c553